MTTIMFNNYRIALRSRVPRTAIISYTQPNVHARALATTGYSPPPNQPQMPRSPKTGSDRNMYYIGGGLAAIGALWYYYFVATESTRVERQRPPPGIDEATRSAARDSAQRAEAAYQDVKGTAQSKAQAVQEKASAGIESGKQRYEEGKDQIGHRVSEARNAAGKWFVCFSSQRSADQTRFFFFEQRNAWTRLKMGWGAGSAGAGRRARRPLKI